MRILIVEDDASVGTMTAEVLEDAGYDTRWVLHGLAALAALPDYQPHLVLCDHMMPHLRGTDLCSRLRTDPRYTQLPTILMSAGADMTHFSDCTAFLRKPFTIDALIGLVQHVLQIRHNG